MGAARSLLDRIRHPAMRRVIEAASAEAARRGEALYLVGGCVRDLLVRVPLKDLDLAVEGDAAALSVRIAEAVGGRLRAVSPFGTCRVAGPGGLRVDVAMSRREVYESPAALPLVSPAPIEEDLRRRDFTINSMAVRLTGPARGEILDPAGGRDDLSRRVLRLHHPLSLADDPTRAFRAARYAVRLALRTAPNWRLALDAAEARSAFERLTPGRLGREVSLMWDEADPAAVAGWCARRTLFGKARVPVRWSKETRASIRRGARWRAVREGSGDPRFLAALLAAAMPAGRRAGFCARVGLTGSARTSVLAAAAAPRDAALLLSGESAHNAFRRAGRLATWPALSLRVAEAAGTPALRREVQDCLAAWERSRPLLRGEDLLALGVPRGPRVGAVLRAIRDARLQGRVRTRSGEEALVRSLAPRTRSRP